MTIERIYTVSLRQGTLRAPRNRRAKKAIRVLGDFVKKHMKCTEFSLSEKLNEHIWQNGMTNPILRVKINAVKDDKGVVSIRLFGEEAPKAETESKVAKIGNKPIKKEDAKPAEVVEEKQAVTAKAEYAKTEESTVKKTATKKTSTKKATKKTATSQKE